MALNKELKLIVKNAMNKEFHDSLEHINDITNSKIKYKAYRTKSPEQIFSTTTQGFLASHPSFADNTLFKSKMEQKPVTPKQKNQKSILLDCIVQNKNSTKQSQQSQYQCVEFGQNSLNEFTKQMRSKNKALYPFKRQYHNNLKLTKLKIAQKQAEDYDL